MRAGRYFALIPAAGTGTRFGGDVPKQYWPIAGKPILLHSIERLAAYLPLAEVVVALAENDRWYDELVGARCASGIPASPSGERAGPRTRVTALRCGGPSRAASVRNALAAATAIADVDWVLVHDAVRPCVERESLARLREEVGDDACGGLLALPVGRALARSADGRTLDGYLPGPGLWRAQTPQMFRRAVLQDALSQPGAHDATDEAEAVERRGGRPRLVRGSAANVKVTWPGDLALAGTILAAQAATVAAGAAVA